jgi:hypothetical protein
MRTTDHGLRTTDDSPGFAIAARRGSSYLVVMQEKPTTLAQRLGLTVHCSPLRRSFHGPSESLLCNEDLVVGSLLLDAPDEPQLLRPAAQLISRHALDVPKLLWRAKLERVEMSS